jgi:hypothetical protein
MTVMPPVTEPAQPSAPALPDYSAIVTTALLAPNFAQLQVAAYSTINALYADETTAPAIITWLQNNAAEKTAIDATLQKYLCFIVVDPSLLPLQGALQQASVADLGTVLGTLLENYIAAMARAKGAA